MRRRSENPPVRRADLNPVAREPEFTPPRKDDPGVDLEVVLEPLKARNDVHLDDLLRVRLDPEGGDVDTPRQDAVLHVGPEIGRGAEGQPADPGMPVRPGGGKQFRIEAAESAARREADGRVVVRLHLGEAHTPCPAVVRVVELKAVGQVVAGVERVRVPEEEAAELEVVRVAERGRGETEIDACGVQVRRGGGAGVAARIERADVRLGKDPSLESKDGEVLTDGVPVLAGPDLQEPDVLRPGLTGQLRTDVDRLRQAVLVEADPPAEERLHGNIGILAGARQIEVEERRSVQEEVALLWKKSGKRVRFTRRWSTSVCAKSVFTVRLARRPGVML